MPEKGNEDPPAAPRPGDPYEVPAQGSLGLLALGYRGLRAWREVRDETLANVEAAHGLEARRRHPAAPRVAHPEDGSSNNASDDDSQ